MSNGDAEPRDRHIRTPSPNYSENSLPDFEMDDPRSPEEQIADARKLEAAQETIREINKPITFPTCLEWRCPLRTQLDLGAPYCEFSLDFLRLPQSTLNEVSDMDVDFLRSNYFMMGDAQTIFEKVVRRHYKEHKNKFDAEFTANEEPEPQKSTWKGKGRCTD